MSAGSPLPSKEEIKSLREWLDQWGDGPNWSDPTGRSLPMDKAQLRRLLDCLDAAILRDGIAEGIMRELERTRALWDEIARQYDSDRVRS